MPSLLFRGFSDVGFAVDQCLANDPLVRVLFRIEVLITASSPFQYHLERLWLFETGICYESHILFSFR